MGNVHKSLLRDSFITSRILETIIKEQYARMLSKDYFKGVCSMYLGNIQIASNWMFWGW